MILSWLKPLQQPTVAQLAVWARWLVLSQQQELKVGYIEIEEPDGNVIIRGTKPPPPPKHRHARTNGNTTAAAATTKSLEGRLKIHSNAVWLRLLLFGSLGLAEAYMASEVDSPDLTAFLVVVLLAENRAATAWTKRTAYDAFFRWSVVGPALLRKAHDVATARLNAVRHYSLSNAVFAAFLDESMTYSCPLWREPRGGPSFAMTTTNTKAGEEIPEKKTELNGHHDAEEKDKDDTLEEAQKRKLRFIVRAARIKPTDHVLEIGGGWGSFAILAARETGCRVTTITPSEEQASLIRERVAAATCPSLSPGQVQVLVCDYREVMPALSATTMAAGKTTTTKKFDKIVSIEMLEHVGHECFETYFRCVDSYLTDAPGGIAVFQSITMSDAHYEAYLRGGDDFIRRYVFPGGELPSVAALVEGIRRGSRGRLVIEDVTSVGAHYARALRCWRQNFLGRFDGEIVPELQRLGRGEGEGGSGKMGKGGKMGMGMMSKAEIEVFRRKWVYYFASCEAAFRTKSIGDVVITVGRDGCVEFLEDSL
ncbi:cyclopropane-fatty-acyl-phospholipid synthase [Apiospora saccharicola]|uniref:Cyclopropane-fatty-acyl-phospholipid synthase n=1 Tax=Apiospora saccharicola TaxID=335842 RepID=A0ABR1W4Z3_9PEZI